LVLLHALLFWNFMFCFEIQSYQKLYKFTCKGEVGRWKWLQAPICQSTNEMAHHLLEIGEHKPPFVFQSQEQTAGKGQQNSKWEAEPGKNLTFTMAVPGNKQEAQWQAFWNMHLCTSLAAWLNEHLLMEGMFQVKWPNDIYAQNKKVAGILIQNQLSGYLIETSLVGIGLNVNQLNFSVEKAMSLSGLTKKTFDLDQLLESWLQYFAPTMPDLIFEKQAIKKNYLKHLYLFQENHWFQNPEGQKFAGRIADVDDQGNLWVETSNGLRKFANKEIIY